MKSPRDDKDFDLQSLLPDGTFDLTFNEITDPRRIALERILRIWMAEKDGELKSKRGGERLQERLNMILDQGTSAYLGDLLSEEACRVRNVARVDLNVERYSPQRIEVDMTVKLASGETFRNLIKMLDGKVFPTDLVLREEDDQ